MVFEYIKIIKISILIYVYGFKWLICLRVYWIVEKEYVINI